MTFDTFIFLKIAYDLKKNLNKYLLFPREFSVHGFVYYPDTKTKQFFQRYFHENISFIYVHILSTAVAMITFIFFLNIKTYIFFFRHSFLIYNI